MIFRPVRALAFYFKIAFFILGVFTLSGCSLGYILEQSQGQYDLLYKRKSNTKVLEDQNVSSELKRKIRLVEEVKKFAEDQIKLKPSKNYNSFVQLNGKYVTYAVTASPKNKIEAYQWSFPIIGSVPYKGFFKKEKAEDEANDLKAKNYDVLVRGVSAYSTLGWFRDPLLSSMTDMDDEDLVETIIHELTHGTIYIKNDSDFNERLATFVGEKGTELFYLQKEGKQSPTVAKLKQEKLDSKIFHQFMSEEIQKLDDFYLKNINNSHLEDLRQEQFKSIIEKFKKSVLPKLKSSNYKAFISSKINNAVLLNYKIYYGNHEYFEKLFEKNQKNWELFFKELSHL